MDRQTIMYYEELEKFCLTEQERDFEKMFQREHIQRKKAEELLSVSEKKLADTEKQLAKARKELDEFVKSFDSEARKETL